LFEIVLNLQTYIESALRSVLGAPSKLFRQAAALLPYLEQMWTVAAEVTEIVEKKKSHQPLGDDPHHLSPK
jgi:hypothetical protein